MRPAATALALLAAFPAALVAPGGARAAVPGKPFADALLRTWIGEHPSDHALRSRLLGLTPPG